MASKLKAQGKIYYRTPPPRPPARMSGKLLCRFPAKTRIRACANGRPVLPVGATIVPFRGRAFFSSAFEKETSGLQGQMASRRLAPAHAAGGLLHPRVLHRGPAASILGLKFRHHGRASRAKACACRSPSLSSHHAQCSSPTSRLGGLNRSIFTASAPQQLLPRSFLCRFCSLLPNCGNFFFEHKWPCRIRDRLYYHFF